MVEIIILDEDIKVLPDPCSSGGQRGGGNCGGNETYLHCENATAPTPDAKETLLPASDVLRNSIQASSILNPSLTSSDDSTPRFRNELQTEARAGNLPKNPKTSSLQRPLKLVLVDSRPFCKTRRKRPHTFTTSDLTHLQQCSCCDHSDFPSAPKGGKDCDSCAENSDDEYDDDAVAIPDLRRKARKKSKRGNISGNLQNYSLELGKRRMKIPTNLEHGDMEVIGCYSPSKRKKMKEAASQALKNVIEKVDWNDAAVALAGIQTTCQRRIAAEAAGRSLGTLREQIQAEVAQSLRAYWTGVLEKSISS